MIEPGGSPSNQDSGSSKMENYQPKNPLPSAMKADPIYSKPTTNNEYRIFGYRKQDDQEEEEEIETPKGWGGQFQAPPQEINIEEFSVPRDSFNEEEEEDINLGT
jgi:hypothetical protein